MNRRHLLAGLALANLPARTQTRTPDAPAPRESLTFRFGSNEPQAPMERFAGTSRARTRRAALSMEDKPGSLFFTDLTDTSRQHGTQRPETSCRPGI